MTGVIFNIQRYSIHDGPGIRTVVFFKGCPMRCRWCENPESLSPHPELSFQSRKCIGCGQCQQACPRGAIHVNRVARIDRERCSSCMICAQNCQAEALEVIGKVMSVEEVWEVVKQDEAFYRRSKGGATTQPRLSIPAMGRARVEEIGKRLERTNRTITVGGN